MLEGQNTKNKILAAHLGGGPGRQGGAQQGRGARGEQSLDGPVRSHTIAAWSLFGASRAPQQIQTGRNHKTSLTDCPFFRSKRKLERHAVCPCPVPDDREPANRQETATLKSEARNPRQAPMR